MKFQLRWPLLLVVVSFCIGNLQSSDEKSLWKIPQTLVSKKYVDLPAGSLPALKFLYENRKITASGHETTDTDPGIVTTKDDYSLETYILSTNHYQIELLTNLDQAPESGALVVVSFPKTKSWLWISGTRLCDSTKGSTGPEAAGGQKCAWS